MFGLSLVTDLIELKHEDLENHATLNHPFINEQQFEIINFPKKEKSDELLEEETRGVDFKGNVRYFCPKCNVRYIGKFNLISQNF
jgi:hypothetical protein